MLELAEASITHCILHKIGNKSRGEDLKTSSKALPLDDEMRSQLGYYFFKPFKGIAEIHQFTHPMKLKMNLAYVTANNIFEGEDLTENSQNIAQHLYNQTRNPAVRTGELFIALIKDIKFNDIVCNGIGIFKSEKKDSFFKVVDGGKTLNLLIDEGINQQKLDKGCLILQHDAKDGFTVFAYEYNGADTDYWRDDFLSIKPRQDEFYLTKNYLNICKDYIVDKLPNEFEVTRAEQIDILNRSVEYFKSNEGFDEKDFVKTVFEEPGIIKSFKSFKSSMAEEGDIAIEDNFSISHNAVKRQAKYFKSVLKLDKNFHIYVHGNKEMIEKGYDEEKGLNYYKIYFKEES